MSNPTHGVSTAYNGRMIKQAGPYTLTTPVSLLDLVNEYPSVFSVRADTQDIEMLLMNGGMEFTDVDDDVFSSEPVDYVGSTPVHF